MITRWAKNPKLFCQQTMTPVPLSVKSRMKAKFHPGPSLKRPDLEAYLLLRWNMLRDEGKAVTVRLLLFEMVRFNIQNEDASPSPDSMRSIIRRFMERYNLTYRARTHLGTFIDEAEMSQTILDYVAGFRTVVSEFGNIPEFAIFNMDQTAVYFDNSAKRTIEERGKKSISIATSCSASFRATVFLCVSFSGVKLRPLVVFKAGHHKTIHKNLKKSNMDGCNLGLAYTVQENAWCDQDTMCDWIELFENETKDIRRLKLLLLDNFSVLINS
jgi:hypothetical protein